MKETAILANTSTQQTGRGVTVAAAVALTFLTLIQALGTSATVALFAPASLGAWAFAYFLVPETQGRSREEIQKSAA